ncbi:toll/interleukin-1 receptor domain-containing protein [Amycolatopsis sp. PS_44_ISF1]|uniref:toll/interleukin-1 receptor domain-containing protein n=1 Tax=Amycolatopsis sp. PS_44_ISF1 TaxID=2974917 RepID=UPI0028DDB8E9|nr:toll/interleukin-1 receptor domain-containing protein [Amycolatopsis sp. PS_44_ISF1]MDT8914087.1 toll/interleukin-1 receptor domain-containing protein [Amycolatopsis sp. PS_44_ISF1]
MTEFVSDRPAVRCFLSFTHEDDSLFDGFITPLRQKLQQYCAAGHGRKVDLFVDRETITWGQDWRRGIEEGLDAATVFIPVVTMHYFLESPACRDELLAFYARAKELGLTDLILPLIIAGHDFLTEDSDDACIRVIEKLQYVDIQDAVVAGAGSARFRDTVKIVAGKLIQAVENAERRLTWPGAPEPGGGDFERRMGELGGLVASRAREFDTVLGTITALVTDGRAGGQSRADRAAEAQRIGPLAVTARRIGTDFELAAAEVEAAVRAYLRDLAVRGDLEQAESARAEYAQLAGDLDRLAAVETSVSGFLAGTGQYEEAVYAPLRAALGPLRLGAQSFQLGVRTLRRLREAKV